jgi:hypothetical protein
VIAVSFLTEITSYMFRNHLFSITPGISFLGSVSVKLLEGEPEHLLEGSGIENQAPRFINQPARYCSWLYGPQLTGAVVFCTVQPVR